MTEARPPLGPALRRAWVAYQRRLDAAMARAGFEDRRFPDGRVLRMCANRPDVTIAAIGRELGISRQGAAKVVNDLRDRGYVTVEPSPTSGREKIVAVTSRAREYLDAQRKAARAIERQLRSQLGDEAFGALDALLDVLGADESMRLRDYLSEAGVREL
jgi:DNA-binding MarR family transcriptional regulator